MWPDALIAFEQQVIFTDNLNIRSSEGGPLLTLCRLYEQVIFTDHSLFGFSDPSAIHMNKVTLPRLDITFKTGSPVQIDRLSTSK